MDYKIIAQRMQQRRSELGLTLSSVAEEVGVATSTIQRYEQGQFPRVKLPVIEKIAAVLRVSVKYLLGYTDVMEETDSFISLSTEQQQRLFERIEDARKLLDMSCGMLSLKTGVPQSFFYRLQRGSASMLYSLDIRLVFSFLNLGDMDAHYVVTGFDTAIESNTEFYTLEKLISEHPFVSMHPATVTGSGMNSGYDDLTAENRALVDDLIAKLLKSQSAD